MKLSEMIKAHEGKSNKELLREIYTNALTIIRVLGSMVVAGILTYQFKFFFEQLYVTSYPINHFMTTFGIIFVFAIFTVIIMYLLKYIKKLGAKLRLRN
ncbi:hypothetical protein [Staphylococcus equorum]|uniref:hypothetical protein n=1 Tax=Staphylococcus equorum TaxID=246432 RepID=UPI003FD8F0BB